MLLNENGSSDVSRFYIILNVVNTITHLLTGIVTAIPLFYVLQGSFGNSFNQHIILCVVGYQLLMAQAIMAFNSSNGWAQGLLHQEKKIIHWVMQVAGSSLAIAGSLVRMIDRSFTLSSPHGIIGLTAMILTIVSLLGGIVNLYPRQFRISPRLIKLCHAFFGSSAFILGATALCLGFDKQTFRAWLGDDGAVYMIVFTVLATAGGLVAACETMFKKIVR